MGEATRREILEKAFDEAESDLPEKEKVEETPQIESKGEEAPDDKVEEKVKEAPDEKEAKAAKKLEKEEKPDGKPQKEETKADEKVPEQKVADKAPNSWKPEVREHWAKLPAVVRDEVNRRELQIQQVLSNTAQLRKFGQDFAQIVQPVAHLIRQQNSTPLAAVQNLFNTAARLSTGDSRQKALVVAEIIGNYQIDIKALDDALSEIATKNGGKIPSAVPQQEQIPGWAKPVVEFVQTAQQTKAAAWQKLQENAAQEISTFQGEFLEDLRDDMADLLDMAANRNRVMTLQQAYDLAAANHPEVSKIIAQRVAAKSAAPKKNIPPKKAASAISGAPKPSVGDKTKSRREQLSEGWDTMVG